MMDETIFSIDSLKFCSGVSFFILYHDFHMYAPKIVCLSSPFLDVIQVQWTLSILTTLFLELLSISNKKLGLLDISVLSKLFLSLCLELLYLEFFSILNKNLGPLQLFLSLSRTFSCLRVH